MSLQLQPTISLADFLILSSLGQARGYFTTVAAKSGGVNTVVDGSIKPDTGDVAVLVDEVQFDGIISGQVTYEFTSDGGEFPAYAIESVPSELNVLNKGSVGFSVENASDQVAVMNVKYVTLDANAYRIVMSGFSQWGGEFGLEPLKVH